VDRPGGLDPSRDGKLGYHLGMSLKTVLTAKDPVLLGAAKSMLDAAEIEYLVVGENAASVFPGGLRVRIQVEADKVDEAKELLANLATDDAPEQE